MGGGDGGVGVAHECVGDLSAFDDEFGFHAEERGVPEDEVREFALLHGADDVGHALGNGRVDGVFGHVALEPEVVGFGGTVCRSGWVLQDPALSFHGVGYLPGPRHYFTNASHGLGVRGRDGEDTEVVQDVFRGDGFGADS